MNATTRPTIDPTLDAMFAAVATAAEAGEPEAALSLLEQALAFASDKAVSLEQRETAAGLLRRVASMLLFSGALDQAERAATHLGRGYATRFRAGVAPWRWDQPLVAQLAAKRAGVALAAAQAPARTPIQRPIDPHRRVTIAHLVQGPACSNEVYRQAELALHDRGAFRLIHYCGVETTPPERVVGDDLWRPVAGLDDGAFWDRIAADGVDILVDHCDLLSGGRLAVLAARPAPVILARGGLLTTGLAAVRWRLSDAVIHPLDGVEPWDETILRLPHYQCHPPPNLAHRAGPRPSGPPRLGVFCQLQKISPATAAAWSAILQALPGAMLTLKRRELSWPGARRRLAALLASVGIDLDRVTMIGDSPAADHLAAYERVDLCLDPFPFGGHTTICEALVAGTPTVALLGDGLVGRMGPSYLIAAGRAADVATSVEAYVARACALAESPPDRAGLREQVAASPLCDGDSWTRSMELGYRQIIAAHNAGWTAAEA